jgi:hypothetical protein
MISFAEPVINDDEDNKQQEKHVGYTQGHKGEAVL